MSSKNASREKQSKTLIQWFTWNKLINFFSKKSWQIFAEIFLKISAKICQLFELTTLSISVSILTERCHHPNSLVNHHYRILIFLCVVCQLFTFLEPHKSFIICTASYKNISIGFINNLLHFWYCLYQLEMSLTELSKPSLNCMFIM